MAAARGDIDRTRVLSMFDDENAYWLFLLPEPPAGQAGLPAEERFWFYETLLRSVMSEIFPTYDLDKVWNMVSQESFQTLMRRRFANFRYEEALRLRTKAEYYDFLGVNDLPLYDPVSEEGADVAEPTLRGDPSLPFFRKLACLYTISPPEGWVAPSRDLRYGFFYTAMKECLVEQNLAAGPNGATFMLEDLIFREELTRFFDGLRLEDAVRITNRQELNEFLGVDEIFGNPLDKDIFSGCPLYYFSYLLAKAPPGQPCLSTKERYFLYLGFVETAAMRGYLPYISIDTAASIVQEPGTKTILRRRLDAFRYKDAARVSSANGWYEYLGLKEIIDQSTTLYHDTPPQLGETEMRFLPRDQSTNFGAKGMCLFASPAPPDVAPAPLEYRTFIFKLVVRLRLLARGLASSVHEAMAMIESAAGGNYTAQRLASLRLEHAVAITTGQELDDFLGIDSQFVPQVAVRQVFQDYRDYHKCLCERLQACGAAKSFREAYSIIQRKETFVKQRFRSLPTPRPPCRTMEEYDAFLGIGELCAGLPRAPSQSTSRQDSTAAGTSLQSAREQNSLKDVDELLAELEQTGKSDKSAGTASSSKKKKKKKKNEASGSVAAESGDVNDLEENDSVDDSGRANLEPTAAIEEEPIPVALTDSSSEFHGLVRAIQNEAAEQSTETSAASGGKKKNKKKKKGVTNDGLQTEAGDSGGAYDETLLSMENLSLKASRPVATDHEEELAPTRPNNSASQGPSVVASGEGEHPETNVGTSTVPGGRKKNKRKISVADSATQAETGDNSRVQNDTVDSAKNHLELEVAQQDAGFDYNPQPNYNQRIQSRPQQQAGDGNGGSADFAQHLSPDRGTPPLNRQSLQQPHPQLESVIGGSYGQNQPQPPLWQEVQAGHGRRNRASQQPPPGPGTTNQQIQLQRSLSETRSSQVAKAGAGSTGATSSSAQNNYVEVFRDDHLLSQEEFVIPTNEALNEQYHRLTLRGMDSLRNVTRRILDQFVMHSQHFYDAILPQKDRTVTQTGYVTGETTSLDTNMFALKINRDEFFAYPLQWNPRSLSNKTALRTCKVKIWKKACEVSTFRWRQVAKCESPEFGPGAWDLGQSLYRYDGILPQVLNNRMTNPVVFKSVLQAYVGDEWKLYNTNLDPIEVTIQSNMSRIQTDLSDLTTTGGDVNAFERWARLRDVLQSIFYLFPAWTMDWIEDWRRLRLFFPTGYLTDAENGSSSIALRDIVYNPPPTSANDLFVFRRGYRTSPRLFPGGVYVNVWTCFAPFYRADLTVSHAIDVVLQIKFSRTHNGSRPLNRTEIQCLETALKHIRVETKLTQKVHEYENVSVYPRRYYRIYGFSQKSCGTLEVPIYRRRNGRLTKSIESYEHFMPFCRQLYKAAFQTWPEIDFRNITNVLKDLPAVKVNPKYDCYLPPWALQIRENDKHGVKSNGILTDFARNMRKELYDHIGAEEYMGFLRTWMRQWVRQDASLAAFSIDIDPTPLQVKAARLPPPHRSLFVQDSNSNKLREPHITPYSWQRQESGNRAAGANVKLVRYAKFDYYMVLHFSNTQRADVLDWLMAFRTKNNIRKEHIPALHVGNPFLHDCGPPGNATQFLAAFDEKLTNFQKVTGKEVPGVVFLFLAVRDVESDIYSTFKYKCDMQLGVRSQVVIMRTFEQLRARGPRYDEAMLNILLKFNKKMGGMNLSLKGPWDHLQKNHQGMMIFGADVTHGSTARSSSVRHSIAAIVGTVDMPPTTYAARVRVQHTKQEIIQETEAMVADLVRTFRSKNPGVELERVFFFRDGVGSDQMCEVLSKEIPATFRGFVAGGAGPNVKLVYLLALKRHHTRFWNRTAGEIQPGTVVNELPLNPLQTSFYLCSHLHPPKGSPASLKKGVCRTTLYHILVDQIGLPLPTLQTLMYHLCYTYEKGTSSLSMVPALHYAHLACSRGRDHYQQMLRLKPEREHSLPSVEAPMRWGDAYPVGVQSDLTVHKNIRDSMYYL